MDEEKRWRVWGRVAQIAVILGVLGGIPLAGYGLLLGMESGLAHSGCTGGGCERNIDEADARSTELLEAAGFGCGALVIVGGYVSWHIRKLSASADD
jgi:hypothetical protein